MIIVIVQSDLNEKTGRMEPVVSHGIDPDTGETHVLPHEPPQQLGAVFDETLGEYVIRDKIIRPGMASKARPR
jgi:hypothetical protein